MTRQRDLEFSPEIARHCPLMRAALRNVGHRQTRNRGTIGGSLCHADPAAELPAVCLTYDARVEISGPQSRRLVPFTEFGVGFMATVLAPDEIVTAVEVPCWPEGHGFAFQEFARRRGDFAIAGAAALMVARADGLVDRLALTIFGVTAVPVRLAAAEAQLAGNRLDRAAILEAAAAVRSLEPLSDVHASPDYRRHIAEVMAVRALRDAAQHCGIALTGI